MEYLAAVVAGYLLGSIPVALIVGRAHGVDLRALGDGNPGAWNALEQLGAGAAAPVFAGDALKGLAAGLTGLALGGVWVAYAAVAAAMLGHAFPLFASFRGGKSVMTFVGGALVLSPPAAAIALALCVAVSLATSFAWGARVGVFAFPLVQLAFDPASHVAATGGLMCIIGVRFLFSRPARPARGTSAPATRAADARPPA
jgi:acyl phosphate:glycerol-3-phosphate acyltransferase